MGLKRSMRFLGIAVVLATLMALLTVAPVVAQTGTNTGTGTATTGTATTGTSVAGTTSNPGAAPSAPTQRDVTAVPGANISSGGASLTGDVTTTVQRIVRPDGTQTGGRVVVIGKNFAAGELVSLYITLPDGRVFPLFNVNSQLNPPACCPQSDETLADGTGGFNATLQFGPVTLSSSDVRGGLPSNLGSLTDGVRYTDTIFLLPGELAASVPPTGVYTVSAQGRVSLAKASFQVTVNPGPATNQFSSTTSTATLTVLTTIGRQSSAKQTDPDRTDVNPNVDIAGNGFIPGEPVSFWVTLPDGSVVPLSTVSADDGGTAFIQLEVLTGKFPTGTLQFSARGNTSNYLTIGSFLLLPGGLSQSAGGATLTASYLGAPQSLSAGSIPGLAGFYASDFLLLTARGFRPTETVTFFQTFPDQSVHFIATVRTDTAGAAVVVLPTFPGPLNAARNGFLGDAVKYLVPFPGGLGAFPIGRQYFSARGDSSGRIATTPFDILPAQA